MKPLQGLRSLHGAYCIAQSTQHEHHEAGSGLAAKALGHSHATCGSGLALNYYYYAYRKRNHGKEDTLSGLLENEMIASIV